MIQPPVKPPLSEDLAGQRFGKLTVLSFEGQKSKGHAQLWKVICECGSERIVPKRNLAEGRTKSCGSPACKIKKPRMPPISEPPRPAPQPTRLTDLHAFAQTCPESTEVKAFMAELGFDLEFKLPAYKGSEHVRPLPPQYHFKDSNGTAVIFLAGYDCTEDRWVPLHKSRWWIYPGSSQFDYNVAMNALRAKWSLKWQDI